ncbi:MAG TPA: sterol desaturase family protein [Novosphingobium sp.]|nr:sterol desaturase family protein [Novosphingobium sp.]
MALLLAFLPTLLVTLALTLVEAWRSRGAPGSQHPDWSLNLQIWAVDVAIALLILPMVQGWSGGALLDGARMPFWLGFAVFLLAMDLGEYAFHWAQHRIPVLWAMHSLHHSDPDMAALTTQRHFWGDQLLKKVSIWSAALVLIRPTGAIYAAYGIASLWNIFTHSNLRVNFGRWSWIINAPALHRRHHSRLPEHYGSNFAGLFPIFDVLFGTYRRPDGFPPTGLAKRPRNLAQVLIWPFIWNRVPPAVPAPE